MDTEKKDESINLRLTYLQKHDLENRAQQYGFSSLSKFVRYILFQCNDVKAMNERPDSKESQVSLYKIEQSITHLQTQVNDSDRTNQHRFAMMEKMLRENNDQLSQFQTQLNEININIINLVQSMKQNKTRIPTKNPKDNDVLSLFWMLPLLVLLGYFLFRVVN